MRVAVGVGPAGEVLAGEARENAEAGADKDSEHSGAGRVEEEDGGEAGRDRHVMRDRELQATGDEEDAERGDPEGDRLGVRDDDVAVRAVRGDVADEHRRDAGGEETREGGDGEELAGGLLPVEPAGRALGLRDRVEDAGLAEDYADEDAGADHGEGDRVGVRAEPRDEGDELLEEVAADAEEGADEEHVGLAEAGERAVDVLSAGLEVALLRGVGRGGDATREGDVRAEGGAEGDVIENCGRAGGRGDAEAEENRHAGEREGVVRADHRAEHAAGGGHEEPEEVHVRTDGECCVRCHVFILEDSGVGLVLEALALLSDGVVASDALGRAPGLLVLANERSQVLGASAADELKVGVTVVGLEGSDLGGGGGGLVEGVAEPLLREAPGQLEPDDAGAEGEDLRVVREDEALNGEGVMRDRGADPGDLVRGHRDAHAGTADEETAIGLPVRDHAGGGDGDVRVVDVLSGLKAGVNDLVDARICFEILLQDILVLDASGIGGENDS